MSIFFILKVIFNIMYSLRVIDKKKKNDVYNYRQMTNFFDD